MFIDLTGNAYERLTVIERVENAKDGKARWLCRCECGNLCVVRGADLKNGRTKSCGCILKEGIRKKHGMHGTSIYRTWANMLTRCENPNDKAFDRYGGRGIKVCERWHDFLNFYADVSILPHFGEKGYTLDRIDNNGDYCLENVRWATDKEQSNNRRNNIKVVYNGEAMTLTEAAEKSGLPYWALRSRYKRGLRGADLFKPLEKTNIIVEYNGEEMILKDAAEKSGIKPSTLYNRYHAGERGEDLFRPKFQRKQ